MSAIASCGIVDETAPLENILSRELNARDNQVTRDIAGKTLGGVLMNGVAAKVQRERH